MSEKLKCKRCGNDVEKWKGWALCPVCGYRLWLKNGKSPDKIEQDFFCNKKTGHSAFVHLNG
jgi:DNA-directed RNA polymerase subunit RPC12/RpoP